VWSHEGNLSVKLVTAALTGIYWLRYVLSDNSAVLLSENYFVTSVIHKNHSAVPFDDDVGGIILHS
jgi:hypothetical protein